MPTSPQTNASTYHVIQTKNTTIGNISAFFGQTKDMQTEEKSAICWKHLFLKLTDKSVETIYERKNKIFGSDAPKNTKISDFCLTTRQTNL